jgi:hypothetical protein
VEQQFWWSKGLFTDAKKIRPATPFTPPHSIQVHRTLHFIPMQDPSTATAAVVRWEWLIAREEWNASSLFIAAVRNLTELLYDACAIVFFIFIFIF